MIYYPRLVADLGGTNIRLAICPAKVSASEGVVLEHVESFRLDDYQSLEDIIEQYMASTGVEVRACCFAIAGPINDGQVRMTNRDWVITAEGLREQLSIKHAALINDFAAIAQAVPFLSQSQLLSIGGGHAERDAPIAVFGPGTGLGAAQLIPDQVGNYRVVATEGGHAGMAPHTELEVAIFDYWHRRGESISREFFICGKGIERLFTAIYALQSGDEAPALDAARIQQTGCAGSLDSSDPVERAAAQAMSTFCELLGNAAGDQVLSTGARGGLVLAGGILPKFSDFLQASNFRQRFETNAAMSAYLEKVPSRLVTESQPGLIGAATYTL